MLLVASGTDQDEVADRYYFSAEYRSWHGSPTRLDGEVPLVIAHPRRSSAQVAALAREVLGDQPTQPRVGELIVRLRRPDDSRSVGEAAAVPASGPDAQPHAGSRGR